MKNVKRFFVSAASCLVVMLLVFGTDNNAQATDQFESSLRLGLKEGTAHPKVQLQELELDQAVYALEEQLAEQQDEDFLLLLVSEERSCSDSEALKVVFAEEYLHCP